ncbi:hypothetical protein ANO11243_082320 [Dothideomycetidae sp. 11243]|nr:hypothetical protein ANO11243_082320 [fungal sp. No.11243]
MSFESCSLYPKSSVGNMIDIDVRDEGSRISLKSALSTSQHQSEPTEQPGKTDETHKRGEPLISDDWPPASHDRQGKEKHPPASPVEFRFEPSVPSGGQHLLLEIQCLAFSHDGR